MNFQYYLFLLFIEQLKLVLVLFSSYHYFLGENLNSKDFKTVYIATLQPQI